MNKELAGNIINWCSLSEWIAGLIIKIKSRYKTKIIQVYAPTSAYDNEDVEKCYEDVEAAVELHNHNQWL